MLQKHQKVLAKAAPDIGRKLEIGRKRRAARSRCLSPA
jgi:hypothetical protein